MSYRQVAKWAAVIWAVVYGTAGSAVADEPSAFEILPPSTAILVEIQRPQDLLGTLYDHRLVRHFMELDRVQAAMEEKKFLDFKAGVAIVESQMGMPWRKGVRQSLGGGITIAFDAKTQGVVALARATDANASATLIETLAKLASLDAKNKGKPDPIKTGKYRGIKTLVTDKVLFAVAGAWTVITNKEDLGKQIIDAVQDKPAESLAGNVQFAKARAAAGKYASAWAYVDTAALRDADLAKTLYGGKAENALVELVFGGLLSTLQHTPFVTLELEVNDRHVQLSAISPYDATWSGELREYYFGSQGQGTAPQMLAVDYTILCVSLSLPRRVGHVDAGRDLFNEQTNDEIAKADGTLTTLFSGKDFGEDILGAFLPAGQVVVTRQLFEVGQPAPAIKLPAIGLVAEMKNPSTMQPELRRTFQSLIGFLNIVGAMDGQPQLDLDMEKTDATEIVTSSYVPDSNAKDPQALKINYNFSPSIAFAGSRFVLASTKKLAQTLATAEAINRSGNDQRVINTDGMLQFNELQLVLADNRGQLVAQNMLKEGHTKEEAEHDIGDLLEVVGWFDRFRISLDTSHSELRLSLDLGTKGESD